MAGDDPPPNERETHSGQAAEESAAKRDFDIDISESILELQPVFEAIAHPRRRYLVYTLAEETEWSLDDLGTKLAAWETDTAEANIATLTRQEMYTSLYHTHVPKLVDLDVIESIFEIVDLLLLFEEHRDERRNLDELVVLQPASISVCSGIFEEPIKHLLIGVSKCTTVVIPS